MPEPSGYKNLFFKLLVVAVIATSAIVALDTLSDHYRKEPLACEASGDDKQSCTPSVVKQSLEQSISEILQTTSLSQEKYIYCIITFKNAKQNGNLQDKFRLTVTSLLCKSSVGVMFLIIGDSESQSVAKSILSETTQQHKIQTTYQVADVDEEQMAHELHSVVEPMQRYFSKKGAYYSDSLFFLSIAIHRLMPESVEKVIMLDADLKFKADIAELHDLFQQFGPANVMGIARENQPVYRHTFSAYRSTHRGTRVGDPPPNGLTGFNSGVLLLDLNAMRRS